jgi:hypothetical protein
MWVVVLKITAIEEEDDRTGSACKQGVVGEWEAGGIGDVAQCIQM